MAAGGGGNIGINVTKVVYYRRTRRKQGSSRAAESGGANFKCYEGTFVHHTRDGGGRGSYRGFGAKTETPLRLVGP